MTRIQSAGPMMPMMPMQQMRTSAPIAVPRQSAPPISAEARQLMAHAGSIKAAHNSPLFLLDGPGMGKAVEKSSAKQMTAKQQAARMVFKGLLTIADIVT